MSDAANDKPGSYRVLARKYRPSTFDDLIGQDAMVRTVSNAFEAGRIPQAWILTGVRGVGKTTTARILARALNYELPDGSVKEPTIKMPVMGVHCQAIIESRHPDVLEMDAASHNSVEDVRQINDAIRYAPMSARYKVYILDEVHMLSGAASVPLPAVRFAPCRCRRFGQTSRKYRLQGKSRNRARRFGLDRARRRRFGARFTLVVRPSDRSCGGPGACRRRAADAGIGRPRTCGRSVRGLDERRRRRSSQRATGAIRCRGRSRGRAG